MKANYLHGLVLLVLAVNLAFGQEWHSLFDGQDLDGWKTGGSPGAFKAVGGEIVCEGPASHLFYSGPNGKAEFRNFEFSAEIMTEGGSDSGVCFHTDFEERGFPGKGFEVQVLNRRAEAGEDVGNELTGSLGPVRNIFKPMAADGEWFALKISVEGKRVRTWANDCLLVDYLEPTPAPDIPDRPGRKLGRGTFALQCQGTHGKVRFRNLRVRELPDKPPGEPAVAPPLTDYDQEILRLSAENYPVINHHVHLKGGLTLEEALAESRRTGVFYGIAVNCGLNFAVTNDAGIYDYLRSMRGQPCFLAMQAEGREWVKMFSKEAISLFDYVFTDSMTIFDDQGRRMRLWIPAEVPEIKDPEAFVDMLVDRTVDILSHEPVHVYVNPTFLPDVIARDYDRLWTEPRMKKVIEVAARRHIAIEINSRYRIPHPAFLKLAKAAGCKFTLGTNNADREIGRLDYSLQMVRELGLGPQDIWLPKLRNP